MKFYNSPGDSCSGASDNATIAGEINDSHTATLDPSETTSPAAFLVVRRPYLRLSEREKLGRIYFISPAATSGR
jgi:hypothetical protein